MDVFGIGIENKETGTEKHNVKRIDGKLNQSLEFYPHSCNLCNHEYIEVQFFVKGSIEAPTMY